MHFTYSTDDGYAPRFSLDGTAKGALAVATTLLNGLLAVVIVLPALSVPLGLLLLGFAHGQRGAQWLWRKPGPKPLALAD